MPTLRTVRVLANRNDKTMRTVNIVTAAHPLKAYEQCLQSAVAGPDIETLQASPSANPNLPTIFIAGYSGPA